MPYPFLRPDETRDARPARPEPGVIVVFHNGVRHFFPGGTEAAAMAIASKAVPPDLWADKRTHIEWGEAVGRAWVRKRVVRKSINHKEEQEE